LALKANSDCGLRFYNTV